MDVSNEYIKMCKNARLSWEPKVGDYCLAIRGYSDYDFRHRNDNGVLGIVTKIDEDVFAIEPIEKDATAWYSIKESIFLPRQDQLQEMMGGFPYVIRGLRQYWEQDNNEFHISGEQITLKYLMNITFGKVWDGSEWIINDMK